MGTNAMSPQGAASFLAIGGDVEIHGLQGATWLNGRRGRIVKFVEAAQKDCVQVFGSEEN